MKIKLFVYYLDSKIPKNIHAISDLLYNALCGATFLDEWDKSSICKICRRLYLKNQNHYKKDLNFEVVKLRLGIKV